MTIDEAIKYCEEIADEQDMKAGFETDYQTYTMSEVEREIYRECASKYRQLAEWLKELEWRRNAMVEIREAMLMPVSIAERISKEVSTECWYRWVKRKVSEVNADE